MPITIKYLRVAALSNLVLFGLAGCSNTPAPWTQTDDSPWTEKHQAEAQAIESDETVSDTSLNDPVLLADTQPPLMEEPIFMQEPETAEPEMIAPVIVEDVPIEQNIMAMLSSNYAVQVIASKSAEGVEEFKNSHDLNTLTTVKTNVAGSTVYVLVDIYPDRAAAEAAAVRLEQKTGSKPWIRSLAGLQKIAVP